MYNADFGWRGSVKKYLLFHVSAHYLQYNNPIGLMAQQRADDTFYNLRTNVGNSSKGAELLVELSPVKAFVKKSHFANLTFFALQLPKIIIQEALSAMQAIQLPRRQQASMG